MWYQAVSTLPRLKHLVLQWWVPFYDARALDRVAERCEEQQSLFPALERLVLDTTNPYLERQDVDGVNVLVAEDDDQYVYDTSCSDLDFLQNPLFMPCLREIRLDRKAAFVCAHSQGFSHFGRNVAVFAGHVPIVPIVVRAIRTLLSMRLWLFENYIMTRRFLTFFVAVCYCLYSIHSVRKLIDPPTTKAFSKQMMLENQRLKIDSCEKFVNHDYERNLIVQSTETPKKNCNIRLHTQTYVFEERERDVKET